MKRAGINDSIIRRKKKKITARILTSTYQIIP
jgi:hypothetical protein